MIFKKATELGATTSREQRNLTYFYGTMVQDLVSKK